MRCKFIDQDGKVCGRETDYKWALCESHYNRVSDFQRKVVHLINRPGMEVQYTSIYTPKATKVVLKLSMGVIGTTVLLECLEGETHITQEQVLAFYGMIKSRPEIHRGLCVSKADYTPEAALLKNSLVDLDLFTLDDLMSSLINFDDYLETLSNKLAPLATSNHYSPLSCKVSDGRLIKTMEDYLENWIGEKGSKILILMGEEGAGKSTLLYRVAHKLTEKARAKTKTRLPLLIPLHGLERAEDWEYFLLNTLSNQYNLRIETYGVLEKVIENGQLVFLLDGLGESLGAVTPEDLDEALNKILKLSHLNNKIIITGPREYFKIGESSTPLLKRLEEAGSEIVDIHSFNKIGINRYLTSVFGEGTPPPVQNAIFGTGEVRELVGRPFWLDLLTHIHARERTKLREDSNGAEVIQLYANLWLNTDVPNVAVPDERNFLADELAYEMTRRGTLYLEPSQYPSSIRERFKDKLEGDGSLKYFDNILTKCKYLDKNEKGSFSFTHKIFVDYFTARRISGELSQGRTQGLEEIALNRGSAWFLSKLTDDPSMLRDKFAQSGGWMKRNIMAILYHKGESFDGMDLSGARLDGAFFARGSFRRAILAGASLKGANLNGANFSMANLEGANLEGANLLSIALSGARLAGANFTGVELGSTDLQGVNFWKVQLGSPEEEIKKRYIKLGAIFTPMTQKQE